jgi:acyl-CoA dehydrogenase
MRRDIFQEDHELFRGEFRKFLDREVAPRFAEWERAGMVPREAWKKAGAAGYLCPWLPEEYGGSGTDFLYGVVQMEELATLMATGFTLSVHNDIIAPYLWNFGTEEQKRQWLPGCASGDIVTAVAMTEPDAGSDLKAIRTTAVKDGGHYVLNGMKTFITNGIANDLVIVAAKTDPAARPAHRGITLFCVEAGTPGYVKGRKLEKIGWRSQDTAELMFEDCRVPVENRLGQEGDGFVMLMKQLPRERLMLAISCVAGMWPVLEMTRSYVKERKAFGKRVADFQNTRFRLAELYTAAEVSQTFLDRLVVAHINGEEINAECAMLKSFASENLKRVCDECLQLFGGYGYMEEYPIARAWRDARLQMIYGGADEIMKEIIARATVDGSKE